MAANRTQSPIDLAKFGYVEQEFLVSGPANIYDWRASSSEFPRPTLRLMGEASRVEAQVRIARK
jgi:hypothetical protein